MDALELAATPEAREPLADEGGPRTRDALDTEAAKLRKGSPGLFRGARWSDGTTVVDALESDDTELKLGEVGGEESRSALDGGESSLYNGSGTTSRFTGTPVPRHTDTGGFTALPSRFTEREGLSETGVASELAP